MALPYIFLILSIVGFSTGFATAYNIEHKEVLSLKIAAESATEQAQALANTAKKHVAIEEETAIRANANIDKANETAIKTINAWRDKYDTARLYDTHRKSCSNSVSEGSTTGKYKSNATDGTKLSAELTQFLNTEALRANKTAVEKNTLLSFVKSNCGIAQ